MPNFDKDAQKALAHIRYLSESLGGRGSCTEQERLAGEYAARQMRALSLKGVRSERFEAVPSTYWGFALAFAAAMTGSLLVLIFGGRGVMYLAALLNIAGIWGMLAETEMSWSWVRLALPRKPSQNVGGQIPPASDTRRRVVLCAHLDTHRTPVFYSSNLWYRAFTYLVSLSFLSMVAGLALYVLGGLFQWDWVRWSSIVLTGIQLAGIALCLQADFTPYSPGANDNASGAAVILALAAHLRRDPLAHTAVHLVFTGCEEVGDFGMRAYLKAHAAELGKDAVYVILDEVGLGRLKYLNVDGLIIKHKTHPQALELARKAKRRLPDMEVIEDRGLAYTDALAATKRGLIALTLCTVPPPGSNVESHWHQMSDRVETLNAVDLAASFEFTWTLLKVIDEAA